MIDFSGKILIFFFKNWQKNLVDLLNKRNRKLLKIDI